MGQALSARAEPRVEEKTIFGKQHRIAEDECDFEISTQIEDILHENFRIRCEFFGDLDDEAVAPSDDGFVCR